MQSLRMQTTRILYAPSQKPKKANNPSITVPAQIRPCTGAAHVQVRVHVGPTRAYMPGTTFKYILDQATCQCASSDPCMILRNCNKIHKVLLQRTATTACGGTRQGVSTTAAFTDQTSCTYHSTIAVNIHRAEGCDREAGNTRTTDHTSSIRNPTQLH